MSIKPVYTMAGAAIAIFASRAERSDSDNDSDDDYIIGNITKPIKATKEWTAEQKSAVEDRRTAEPYESCISKACVIL